ncbi:MAG: carboxymuconolactone decarboxylase family protein [Burkholderiaceae bacterium]
MDHPMYPPLTRDTARQRAELTPEIQTAFKTFSARVFADGALPNKTKQLIAVAAAHVTQCPYCIRGHTELALKAGNTQQEIMEAIWVAAEMRAGAAYAHATLAIDTMNRLQDGGD